MATSWIEDSATRALTAPPTLWLTGNPGGDPPTTTLTALKNGLFAITVTVADPLACRSSVLVALTITVAVVEVTVGGAV
jgi:hypothetical protein